MNGAAAEHTQLFFQFAAFWWAVWSFQGPHSFRFLMGLALGAGCARLGWAALHASAWFEAPRSVLEAGGGFTLLAVPLGPLLLTPRRGAPQSGLAFRAATARALTPAFALSRLGCWGVGCCTGTPLSEAATHPVALYEVIGWLCLSAFLRSASACHVPGLWLVGFGALRVLLEPFRTLPPLGEPEIDVVWIAVAWMGAGGLTWWFDTQARSDGQSKEAGLRSKSPSSEGTQGGGVSMPFMNSSAARWLGVFSRFSRPRMGAVRLISKRPSCRPSRS